MEFTKGFILSETDLNCFMSDFLDDFLRGYSRDRNEDEYDIYENFTVELNTWFADLLEMNGMDEMIVFADGTTYEVITGDRLADIYGDETILDTIREYFGISDEEEEED